jgi:hypothetical protein
VVRCKPFLPIQENSGFVTSRRGKANIEKHFVSENRATVAGSVIDFGAG